MGRDEMKYAQLDSGSNGFTCKYICNCMCA